MLQRDQVTQRIGEKSDGVVAQDQLTKSLGKGNRGRGIWKGQPGMAQYDFSGLAVVTTDLAQTLQFGIDI